MTTRRQALHAGAAAGFSLLLPACRRTADDASAPDPAVRPGALRIDLRHGVRDGAHAFELLRLRREPHWPRRPGVQLPDWGDFRVTVSGPGDALLYREGFDSSIDGAARAAVTELSVRVPLPVSRARLAIERRRAGATFAEVAAFEIDPHGAGIDASPAAIAARIDTLLANGPPEHKVDIAILGDGYRGEEYSKFAADAKRAVAYLFSVEPFAKRAGDFNVVSLFTPSAGSGITDPYTERRADTIFRSGYGGAAAERTLAVGDNGALREAASNVPYDFLLVLANARRYGGSAHFGGPAVAAIDSAAARYLVLHELGHAIGGLAEEYYLPAPDGGPDYRGNVEPWNPNVTISPASSKWRARDAMPSSWNKSEYERDFVRYVREYERLRERRADESAVEDLMRRAAERQAVILAKNQPPRRTGFFEGAHGYAKGAFRAEADCIMFSLQTRYFCSACEGALERAIDTLIA